MILILFIFYTQNSIEKVQLPDMGSYRCAVKTESGQTLSEEGSIQLEGEFIFSSLRYTITSMNPLSQESDSAYCFLRPSSFLCGASAHVCSGQHIPESELRGPRTSRACQGHLAAGWRSPQHPNGPSGPVTLHAQPHRYHLSLPAC